MIFGFMYQTVIYKVIDGLDHTAIYDAYLAYLRHGDSNWTRGSYCIQNIYTIDVRSVRCQLFPENDANTYQVQLILKFNFTIMIEAFYVPWINNFKCYLGMLVKNAIFDITILILYRVLLTGNYIVIYN